MAKTSIDICVCTFRRPHLRETLASVGRLEAPEAAIRIIVADNDHRPSAHRLVTEMAEILPCPVLYLHVPASNISRARNACLEAANGDFVAFIDDDETCSPQWLSALLAAAPGADAVLGPVEALYRPEAPAWLARGGFHATAPVRVRGRIETGYTCNALIRRSPLTAPLRFDPALGRTGGEDTDYFYRLTEAGGVITEAPEALVFEPVPPEREKLGWLIRRRVRAGHTHGSHLRRSGRVLPMPLAPPAAKTLYCLAMMAAMAASPAGWRRNLLRASLHFGVLRGLLGRGAAAQYGTAARDAAPPGPWPRLEEPTE